MLQVRPGQFESQLGLLKPDVVFFLSAYNDFDESSYRLRHP